jgi:hypothetical protein
MKRIVLLVAALLMPSITLSQRIAENAKILSEQLVQKIGSEKLIIENNSELIQKQTELYSIASDFNVRRLQSTAVDDFFPVYFQSRLDFKRITTLDRVVKTDVTDNLTNKTAQERITKEFCIEQNGKDCEKGLGIYVLSLASNPPPRSEACIAAQQRIYDLSGFNEGDGNHISTDKLKDVMAYHSACTTADIPQHMRKLLGIIIDTTEPLGKKDTGIYLPDIGKFAPVGMAVQVAPNRIYTARHVLYHPIGENKFGGKRDLEKLLFLPITAPGKLIFLSKEIRPASMSQEFTEPFDDQAIVEMSAMYAPTLVKWPIVAKSEINVNTEATPLFIAGFQMALARAEIIGVKPEQTSIPIVDWPKYVRRDSAGSCRRVTQNNSGCMLHACDTVGGLSGSPIFAQLSGTAGDQASVIGVHRGGAFNASMMLCSAGVDGRDLNIGVVPNIALIQN